MSKTQAQIQSDVVRIGRIANTDSASLGAIIVDSNDAINIIASKRNWDELYRTGTLSLLLADGDKNYPLSNNVDKVDLVRITSPINYAKEITAVLARDLLAVLGAKTNNGTGTPNQWYYSEPTVASNNVETKNMSFDIMPDQSYTVTYRYRTYPPQLVNTTDYPFFDQNYHHIIVDYCLMQYAKRNPDQTLNPDSFELKWARGLNDLLSSYDSKIVRNTPIPGPMTFGL